MGQTRVQTAITKLERAVKVEIDAAQRDPSKSFEIRDGRLLHWEGERGLYSFRAEVTIPLPPETPIRFLVKGHDPVDGRIVAQEDFEVVLDTEQVLGDDIPEARITSEPWFIQEKLRERLLSALIVPPEGSGQNAPESKPPWIPDYLLGHAFETGEDVDAAREATEILRSLTLKTLYPNDSQERALSRCAVDPLHFVWGPPGTGKTASLAQIALLLHGRGERVLVLSHTNAAVDVAMLRVAAAFESSKDLPVGKVLRYGTPQMPEVRNHQHINPEHVLERKYPDLIARKRSLERRRRQLTQELREAAGDRREELARELDGVREELADVNAQVRQATQELISAATVLGTTLSRFAIDDIIWTWKPDAVLIDEISMANFPFVMAAGLVAVKRLILLGDFRQLAPIVQSRNTDVQHWLGRDAFEISGVVGRINREEEEPRVSLLRTQYRMAPSISDAVNRFAYGGRLENGPGLDQRAASLIALEPGSGSSLVLIDTSEIEPACFRDPRHGSYSRINPLHAILGIDLSQAIFSTGHRGIALITPYRAQARLYAAAVYSAAKDSELRAATVHRFQGAERDIVIMDLVDAFWEKGASELTGENPDAALRLLNVALSRAKGKVIVLANERFIVERHPAHSPARRLLALLNQLGHRVDCREAPLGSFPSFAQVDWHGDWKAVQADLAREIALSSSSVFLNLPDGFPISEELKETLLRVEDLGDRSFIIFCSFEVAKGLERSKADLRLINRPGGFFALLDEETALVGGLSQGSMIARIHHPLFVERLSESLLGSSLRLPSPDADIEDSLDAICGRCPDCGAYRRPVLLGQWALRCAERGHTQETLSLDALTRIFQARDIRCEDCGGTAVARKSGRSVFIGCANLKAGCKGRFPHMRILFPGS